MHANDYRSSSPQVYWKNSTPSKYIDKRHYACFEGQNFTLDVKERQKTPIERSLFLLNCSNHTYMESRDYRGNNLDIILMEKSNARSINSDLQSSQRSKP